MKKKENYLIQERDKKGEGAKQKYRIMSEVYLNI